MSSAVWTWVAIGLLVAALVPAGLAWAGRIRFRGSGRQSGRAFTLLDVGALLQAVAQLPDDPTTRWIISPIGAVFVIVGAVLLLRMRTTPVNG